ncbi:hypothetical protein C8Q70DRAFT_1026156 [Cubamyces menziesii]|nr:hypothetical protein C8Q70DRAFT_1026156 [Cubamyces menziesii]
MQLATAKGKRRRTNSVGVFASLRRHKTGIRADPASASIQPDVATAGCLSDPAGSPSAALNVIQATHDQDSSIAHR